VFRPFARLANNHQLGPQRIPAGNQSDLEQYNPMHNSLKIMVALLVAVGVAISPISEIGAKDSKPVKVVSAKTFKGTQDIVIGSFNVAFVIEKKDKAFAGMGRQYGGSSEAKALLAGVSAAEYQAITDAAYADFLAKMTAAGYRIADRSALMADPGVAKQKYVPSGAEATVIFGKDSKAKAVYYAPTAFGPMAISSGEIAGGTFAGFGNMGPLMARGAYVQKAKQPVMNVRYVVDFAGTKHYGGAFAMSSSIKLKAQLAIVSTLSSVTLQGLTGQGTMTLAQPIAVEGDFGELADSTTRGQKIDQALGNVIGILGGVGTSSRKQFTFTADAAGYRDGAISASTRANDLFAAQLAALK
jgi:hypothetical protein